MLPLTKMVCSSGWQPRTLKYLLKSNICSDANMDRTVKGGTGEVMQEVTLRIACLCSSLG